MMMMMMTTIVMTTISAENSTYNWCCRALAEGDYTDSHSQEAKTVRQELAVKCGVSKGAPMPCYKHEPQSVLENTSYKLYYDRSIISDLTIHSNRPDIVTLDKTIKEIYSIHVALPKSQPSQHITEKLQKYKDTALPVQA